MRSEEVTSRIPLHQIFHGEGQKTNLRTSEKPPLDDRWQADDLKEALAAFKALVNRT